MLKLDDNLEYRNIDTKKTVIMNNYERAEIL